jgi:hypothetical protein
MTIFLVIREFPDRDIEIDAFRIRPRASAYVKAVVRDHVRDGIQLTREDDRWTSKHGDLSIEIREVEVR